MTVTNSKFARECDGIAKALTASAKQASSLLADEELKYDREAAAIMVSDLRNLADEIEKAAV